MPRMDASGSLMRLAGRWMLGIGGAMMTWWLVLAGALVALPFVVVGIGVGVASILSVRSVSVAQWLLGGFGFVFFWVLIVVALTRGPAFLAVAGMAGLLAFTGSLSVSLSSVPAQRTSGATSAGLPIVPRQSAASVLVRHALAATSLSGAALLVAIPILRGPGNALESFLVAAAAAGALIGASYAVERGWAWGRHVILGAAGLGLVLSLLIMAAPYAYSSQQDLTLMLLLALCSVAVVLSAIVDTV